jgi:hypothetical protein
MMPQILQMSYAAIFFALGAARKPVDANVRANFAIRFGQARLVWPAAKPKWNTRACALIKL